MNICNTGVLILGESGKGKSETALSLIDRGHQLVSDDAVTLEIQQKSLLAYAPNPINQTIQLADIGIIDPTKIYKPSSVTPKTSVQLVFEITSQKQPTQNLNMSFQTISLLNFALPLLKIQHTPFFNLALKLETSTKQFRLMGTNSLCNKQ